MRTNLASSKKRGSLPGDAGERYVRRIAHAYFVRFHMSLILAAVIASGVLASKGLLEAGVHSLRLRYPLAVLGSYLVFLLLVRVWIWYVSARGEAGAAVGNSVGDALDDGDSWDGSFGSGGGSSSSGGGSGGGFMKFGEGSSGGGGASDGWATDTPAAFASEPAPASSGSSAGWLPKLDLDFDGDDGWVVLLLLAALVLAIVGAGGYLVYAAPQILPEAAWQALLAGTLTRVSKQTHQGWIGGVFRSTCIPFVIVLLLAGALGWEAHHYCPSAPRLIDVLHCAMRGM